MVKRILPLVNITRNYVKDLTLYSTVNVKFKIYILLLFLFPFTFCAQLNRDAYAALFIHDYFKAKKLFHKSLNRKSNSSAAFGLAVIYARNNNPFFEQDSAIKYASTAFNLLNTDKAGEVFGTFKINQQIIRDFIDTLGRKKLNAILPLNQKEPLNHFLKVYSLCNNQLLDAALNKRDELVFREVKQLHESKQTQAFIETHPYSPLLKEAAILKDRQVYEEITASKDASAYRDYIRLFPSGAHVLKAYRELLSVYKKNKNTEEIYNYIRSYPLSPQLQEAWETLFTLSVSTYSDEELQNFLRKYPDFPYKNSIIRELQLNKQILIPVSLNSKKGFTDTSGKLIIGPEYDEIGEFLEGLSVVQKGDSVFYINKANNIFLNRFFEEAFPFHNGIAAVKQKGKWFFINRMGEQIGDTLEEINPLSDESYVCQKNNLYGSLNMFAEPETPFQYEKLGDFVNRVAYCQKKNLYGFITKNGYTHDAEFDWISDFNTIGQAIFRKGGLFGIISSKGQILLPPAYDQILIAPGHLYLLVKNNLYGYYSGEECYLTDIRFPYKSSEKPEYYTNGKLLKCYQKDKLYVCDLNGKIIAEPGNYEEVYMHQSELLRVMKNGKYGYMNHQGNLSIPLKFIKAVNFTDSVAIVETKKKHSLIGTSGKEIFTSGFEIEKLEYGIYSTEDENEERIFLNGKGNILPFKIKEVESYENYLILYLENDAIKILKQL
jgi:hypothetical protein